MEKINRLIEEVRLAEIKKIKVYSEEQIKGKGSSQGLVADVMTETS